MASSTDTPPAWLTDKGLASVYLPDPPALAKLLGNGSTTPEADFEQALSDQTLERIRAAGANLIWMPFFSGLGVEFEKDHLEQLKEFSLRAKSKGLRVAARIMFGALVPETMLMEESESQNWLQVNQDGQSPAYGSQPEGSRIRPCYNSEGYLRYMERVCGLALEAEVNAIHFEGLGYNPEPDTCHCPVCIAVFREMLRDSYGGQDETSREAGQARFGYNTFTHIRPPIYSRDYRAMEQKALQGVHQQEWLWFKVRSVSRGLERLVKFVERKSQDCAVGATLPSIEGGNLAWLNGIGHAELLPKLDLVLFRDIAQAGALAANLKAVTHSNTLIHSFPIQETSFDLSCGTLQTGAAIKTALALDLALNATGPRSLGPANLMGSPAPTDSFSSLAQSYGHFYAEHFESIFSNVQPVRQVGVLRDETSLAFDCSEPHTCLAGTEQALQENSIPYDLLTEIESDRLGNYEVIVLPSSVCLSSNAAQQLREHTENGGNLLLLGNTGVYDPWRRKHPRPTLSDLFGPAYPQDIQVTFGSGKATLLRRIPTPSAAPSEDRNKFISALRGLLQTRPLEISAEAGQPIGHLLKSDSGDLVLHIINLDPESSIRDLCVSVTSASGPELVNAFEPAINPRQVTFETNEEQKTVVVRLKEMSDYCVLHYKGCSKST